MSRKGHYLGGGTKIGSGDKDWFKKGSTTSFYGRGDTKGPPLRSAAEKAELEAFRLAQAQPTLIKKGQPKSSGKKKSR